MKKLIFSLALFVTLVGFGSKAEAYNFTKATQLKCDKSIDIANSNFLTGNFVYNVYNVTNQLTWDANTGAMPAGTAKFKISRKTGTGSWVSFQTVTISPQINWGAPLNALYPSDTFNGYEGNGVYLDTINYGELYAYRVDFLNSSDASLGYMESGEITNSNCLPNSNNTFTFWTPGTINNFVGQNKVITGPGATTTDIVLERLLGTKYNFNLSVVSILNSSGISVLGTTDGITANSFTPSVLSSGSNPVTSTFRFTASPTLPNGVYDVTVKAVAPKTGGQITITISDEGLKNRSGQLSYDINLEFQEETKGISTGSTNYYKTKESEALQAAINTEVAGFVESICGSKNGVVQPYEKKSDRTYGINFYCKDLSLAPAGVSLTTTFKVTYNGVIGIPNTPIFDYKLAVPTNPRIDRGASATDNVISTLLITPTQPVLQFVSKILNDKSGANVFNQANGLSTTTGAITPNPNNPTAGGAVSTLKVSSVVTTPAGLYTVFVSGKSNITPPVGFTTNGVSGTCKAVNVNIGTGYDGVTGSNILDCSVNGVRVLSSVLSRGYGTTVWSSTDGAADAAAQFGDLANKVCGTGNWTSATAPLSFSSANTTETFACTATPSIPSLNIARTTAYQIMVDPYELGVADYTNTCTNSTNALNWNVVTGAVGGYNIYRKEGQGNYAMLTHVSPSTINYFDIVPTPGAMYGYYIAAVDGVGAESAPSTQVYHISKALLDPNSIQCSGTGATLNGTCTVAKDVNDKPVWTALGINGVSPYTYVWGTTPTGNVISPIPPGNNYRGTASVGSNTNYGYPSVTIKDASGKTFSPSCSNPVPNTGANLDLTLSKDGGKTQVKTLIAIKGKPVQSGIVFGGVKDSCTFSDKLPDLSESGSQGSPSKLIGMVINTNTIGKFTLKIRCDRSDGLGLLESKAFLEVRTSPGYIEF